MTALGLGNGQEIRLYYSWRSRRILRAEILHRPSGSKRGICTATVERPGFGDGPHGYNMGLFTCTRCGRRMRIRRSTLTEEPMASRSYEQKKRGLRVIR